MSYLDYRYAEAVLSHRDFVAARDDVVAIFSHAEAPLLDQHADPRSGGVKRRKRAPLKGSTVDRYFFFPVDQKALNRHLEDEFRTRNWEIHPPIVPREPGANLDTGLAADFKKGRLQAEVQFGNMARWYTDVFKFQLSYSRGDIDVAILVVATQRFANCIDENVAYFERVQRELPHARMSLTLPIWVIGIEPEDFHSIETAYDQAFEHLRRKSKQPIEKISFADRTREEPILGPEDEGTSDGE